MPNRDERRQRKSRNFNVCSAPKWLICCEGESEVNYLNDLINDLSQGKKHNICVGIPGCKKCAGDVVGACRRQGSQLAKKVQQCASGCYYDKVWVVFDEDGESPRGAEDYKRQDFANTIRAWRTTPDAVFLYDIAWTKPKFEYWLLLSKDGIGGSGLDKTEDDVKHYLEEYYNVNPRLKIPSDKHRKISKPYENSYFAFGGFDGAQHAVKRAAAQYKSEGIREIEKSGCFDNIPAGTSMHLLVSDIITYFRKYIYDQENIG